MELTITDDGIEKKAIDLMDKFGDKAIDVVREIKKSYPTEPHYHNTYEEVSEWNEDANLFWGHVVKYIKTNQQ